MADADEDVSHKGLQTHDRDLSEETQDFRFLNSIVNAANLSESASIPKRGEKDFEPNATNAQASSLAASRQAMHTALSYPRLHQAKTHLVAQYCADESRYGGACVRVDNAHGPHFRTIGRGDSKNRIWLLPEEALYLIERGSLDIRWPDRQAEGVEGGDQVEGQEDDGDEPLGELPMSLQGAYASFIGRSGLTLERYQVFAGLRRLGYTVVRAPTWSDSQTGMNGHSILPADSGQLTKVEREFDQKQQQASGNGIIGLIHGLVRYLFVPSEGNNNKACPSFGPLVAPGLYRNYNDIYRALTLIPFETGKSRSHLSSLPTELASVPKPPFRITYHVWKPSTAYRKSNPPAPDFRVAVLDARKTSVPTMTQIGALLDSMPDNELPKEKPLEARLKYGKRNVILAIVDMGIVSYLRFGEATFGAERLFENKTKKRQWKKGGYGGRDGGRGRGGKSNA
jgi:tRNA-splicing endonuclease subunit Sen54